MNKSYNFEEIKRQILNGKINGLIIGDFEVEDKYLNFYRKLPPLFSKRRMKLENVDYNQRNAILENELMTETQEFEQIILGLKAEKTMVSSSLFKWYHQNQVAKATDIDVGIQYEELDAMQPFMEKMIAQRYDFEKKE